MTEKHKQLRERIRNLVAEYHRQAHATRPFTPGETRVRYASRVYDERELMAAVDACLDFWLTAGPNAEAFERRLAETVGVRYALAVNSGSSANLVAVSALCSRSLERPLEPGDEVIAPAMGFPCSVTTRPRAGTRTSRSRFTVIGAISLPAMNSGGSGRA